MVLKIGTPPIKVASLKTKNISKKTGGFSLETGGIQQSSTSMLISEISFVQEDGFKKERGVKKGKNLLDGLDNLKLSLLKDETPDISRLQEFLTQEVEEIDDNLQNILDEIETRAAVEIAKISK